jgi:hypothetical protein
MQESRMCLCGPRRSLRLSRPSVLKKHVLMHLLRNLVKHPEFARSADKVSPLRSRKGGGKKKCRPDSEATNWLVRYTRTRKNTHGSRKRSVYSTRREMLRAPQ